MDEYASSQSQKGPEKLLLLSLFLERIATGGSMIAQKPLIPMREVSRHAEPGDCWVVIFDKVYDVSAYLDEHPGGRDMILKVAGVFQKVSWCVRVNRHIAGIAAENALKGGRLPMRTQSLAGK